MNVPRLGMVALCAPLIASGLACGDGGDSRNCPVPPEDVTIGTTEECVRQVFFDGCELNIPTPLWEHRTLFSVESDQGVTVWFKASEEQSELYDFVVDLSHSSGHFDEKPVVTFESETEVEVDGTRVRLYGSPDARNATWKTDCVAYFVAALESDMTLDDVDAALLSVIERSLEASPQ